MPRCAWILIGALTALLHTLGALPATAHAITAAATWTLTHPSGLALTAALALWHLTTQHGPLRHAHA